MVALVGACAHEKQKAPPPSDDKEEAAAEKGATAPTSPAEAAQASGVQVAPSAPASGAAAKPLPPNIKILVRVTPSPAKGGPDKAQVFWGKKKLGDTPVTLERPRDSGPVDLVVRSDGFFPVHTRAYTVRNDVLYVKMTKLDDRMKLFGAKQEAEAVPGGVPDGGVPPPGPPSTAPGAPPATPPPQ
jgi:hypothetical protein